MAIMILNKLIITMPDHELNKNIKFWETELAHCLRCYMDPLTPLEWLDLYRAEIARRHPINQNTE